MKVHCKGAENRMALVPGQAFAALQDYPPRFDLVSLLYPQAHVLENFINVFVKNSDLLYFTGNTN